jgi:hypothetical protein
MGGLMVQYKTQQQGTLPVVGALRTVNPETNASTAKRTAKILIFLKSLILDFKSCVSTLHKEFAVGEQ